MIVSERGCPSHGDFSPCPVYLQVVFYQPTISQGDIVLKVKDIEGLGFQSVLVEGSPMFN